VAFTAYWYKDYSQETFFSHEEILQHINRKMINTEVYGEAILAIGNAENPLRS